MDGGRGKVVGVEDGSGDDSASGGDRPWPMGWGGRERERERAERRDDEKAARGMLVRGRFKRLQLVLVVRGELAPWEFLYKSYKYMCVCVLINFIKAKKNALNKCIEFFFWHIKCIKYAEIKFGFVISESRSHLILK